MSRRAWVGLLAAIGLLGLVAPAQAADPPGRAVSAEARARHAAAVEYWTPERVATAVPAMPIRVPSAMAQPPGDGELDCSLPKNRKKPECDTGGGGDGGGGDGGTVNCKKKENRDLDVCAGGGGGGGDLPPGPPDPSTGSPWTGSIYDDPGDDVRVLVGKVLFTLGETDYVCSGSVVDDGATDGRALVMTAGHCVHQGDNVTWATNWTFFPDFDNDVDGSVFTCGDSPYGCWTASALVVAGDWALAGHFDYDIGFAVLGPGGHEPDLGPMEQLLDVQQAAPATVGFHRERGEFVSMFGYPHADPYDGTELSYCAGDAIPYHWLFPNVLLYSYAQGLTCSHTGGTSGGPWYGDFDAVTGTGTVMSVNSYKMSNDPNTIYGTFLGNYARDTYEAAKDATVNTRVPRPPVVP